MFESVPSFTEKDTTLTNDNNVVSAQMSIIKDTLSEQISDSLSVY